MRERIDRHMQQAKERLRVATWPVAQASVGAALAWWITHTLLGHPQPFFAPIAAAISLSTSPVQRGRRSLQMLTGVLLGIAIGELLAGLLGTSTVALGVIVFVTMVVALAIGSGFIGEGMMFANQAAASAILVVALHRHGTGAERALDAIVGAAVAVVIGVVLFPANPLVLLQESERVVLRGLARAVRDVLDAFREGKPVSAEWTLSETARIHAQLARLGQARKTAGAVARVAPRRRPVRSELVEEDKRAAQLDLLANTVLSLIRTTAAAAGSGPGLSPQVQHNLERLCLLLNGLADAARPWPSTMINEVSDLATSILEDTAAGRDYPVITSIMETTAQDLLRMVR